MTISARIRRRREAGATGASGAGAATTTIPAHQKSKYQKTAKTAGQLSWYVNSVQQNKYEYQNYNKTIFVVLDQMIRELHHLVP